MGSSLAGWGTGPITSTWEPSARMAWIVAVSPASHAGPY